MLCDGHDIPHNIILLPSFRLQLNYMGFSGYLRKMQSVGHWEIMTPTYTNSWTAWTFSHPLPVLGTISCCKVLPQLWHSWFLHISGSTKWDSLSHHFKRFQAFPGPWMWKTGFFNVFQCVWKTWKISPPLHHGQNTHRWIRAFDIQGGQWWANHVICYFPCFRNKIEILMGHSL